MAGKLRLEVLIEPDGAPFTVTGEEARTFSKNSSRGIFERNSNPKKRGL